VTRIGVQVGGAPLDPIATVDAIVRAEQAGVSGVWLVQASTGGDALSILAAAALRTRDVELGIAVLPAPSRHPLVTAAQASTVAALSNGRLRLGIGSSHRQISEDVYGVPFTAPQARLREYVGIVRGLLEDGAVDEDGAYWSAHAAAPPCDVPMLIGALGPAGFRMAGELADGAVAWLCPPAYLREVARRSLDAGARAAHRSRPRLVAHLLVAVTDDVELAAEAAARRIARNLRMPYYARVLERSGLAPDEPRGAQRAVEALLVAGPEADVRRRLLAELEGGIDELLLTPLPVSRDPDAELMAVCSAVGAIG
jgi:F420-dependent oxidoreductase-like protein